MNSRKRLLVFLMLATASVLAGVLAIDSSALAGETCGYKGPLQMVEMKPLSIALGQGIWADLNSVVQPEENRDGMQVSPISESRTSDSPSTGESPDTTVTMSPATGEIEIQPSSELSSADSFGVAASADLLTSVFTTKSGRASAPKSKLTQRIESAQAGLEMVQGAFAFAKSGISKFAKIRPFPLKKDEKPAAAGSDLENPASEL